MDSEVSIKQTEGASFFKSASNIIISLLVSAIIGAAGLAQHYFTSMNDKLKSQQEYINLLKHDFDVYVQKNESDHVEFKQRDSQHDDELKEHDNAIDRNHEDIIRVQDFQSFKK